MKFKTHFLAIIAVVSLAACETQNTKTEVLEYEARFSEEKPDYFGEYERQREIFDQTERNKGAFDSQESYEETRVMMSNFLASQKNGEELTVLAASYSLFDPETWKRAWDGLNQVLNTPPDGKQAGGFSNPIEPYKDLPESGPGVAPPGAIWQSFDIVGKSYISLVSPPKGSGLGTLKNSKVAQVFAKVTDAGFNENPVTPAKAKDYRLFSQAKVSVSCQNGKMLDWTRANILTDTGTEPAKNGVQAPDGWLAAISFVQVDAATLKAKWVFLGTPPAVLEPGIQIVQRRTGVFIWHEVNADIVCKGNKATITPFFFGSGFPSHRLWINGKLSKTVPQGPFSNLWQARKKGSNVVR